MLGPLPDVCVNSEVDKCSGKVSEAVEYPPLKVALPRIHLSGMERGGCEGFPSPCPALLPHCSFCWPSVTEDTAPWPLLTSLMQAHWPSRDSFHNVTCQTGRSTVNMACTENGIGADMRSNYAFCMKRCKPHRHQTRTI